MDPRNSLYPVTDGGASPPPVWQSPPFSRFERPADGRSFAPAGPGTALARRSAFPSGLEGDVRGGRPSPLHGPRGAPLTGGPRSPAHDLASVEHLSRTRRVEVNEDVAWLDARLRGHSGGHHLQHLLDARAGVRVRR